LKEPPEIGIGVLGMCFIETSVVQILLKEGHRLAKQVDIPLNLNGIIVRNTLNNLTPQIPRNLIRTELSKIITNPDINVIIELFGGGSPISDSIKKSISLSKPRVHDDKEVMSKFRAEILRIANKNNVYVLFEASVEEGISLIDPKIPLYMRLLAK